MHGNAGKISRWPSSKTVYLQENNKFAANNKKLEEQVGKMTEENNKFAENNKKLEGEVNRLEGEVSKMAKVSAGA